LRQSGCPIVVFGDVEADPAEEIVCAGLELARSEQSASSSVSAHQWMWRNPHMDRSLKGDRLPLIQVPTTAGTVPFTSMRDTP
jgi:alcohol dehydrogenase class IV